jgi:hypothetical protein
MSGFRSDLPPVVTTATRLPSALAATVVGVPRIVASLPRGPGLSPRTRRRKVKRQQPQTEAVSPVRILHRPFHRPQ